MKYRSTPHELRHAASTIHDFITDLTQINTGENLDIFTRVASRLEVEAGLLEEELASAPAAPTSDNPPATEQAS